MRGSNLFGHSIRMTQAVTVLVASLAISIVLSTIQLGTTLASQEQAAIELAEEILTLAEGGATTASWTLDEELAEGVVQSVIALGEVQTVVLLDEKGEIMAEAARGEASYGPLVRAFSRVFLGEPIRGERRLQVSVADGVRSVGTLSIALAPEHVAERFVTLAIPVLVSGLVQATAIGLVLLWLSSLLVTSPLQRAADAIAAIDPEDPQAIAVPAEHAENELGNLLGHTNQMVQRLSEIQEELRNLATHDPLTQLPNRSFVVNRLERALLRAGRNGTRAAVLFLDLDDFKAVNDSHGHTHGDEFLVETARRLRTVLRSNDSVGRLGGDEFLVVLESIGTAEEAVATIQRIEAAFAEPFQLGANIVPMNTSIGVAVYPEDGSDASGLMRHADMAMYQAKATPGSAFRFFAQEMSERIQARLKKEVSLRAALALGEFELAYQPKVDARSGELAGCEALLRWRRGDTLVPAADFIDTAEQAGIIGEIGELVLDTACAQSRDWAERYRPIPIAINVSAQQLRAPGFIDRIFEAAQRDGVRPEFLELEITETVLIEELNQASERLDRLRNAGFVVSIDDFGTGYSSLSYLTHLPANSLKIDRTFVSGPQSSEVILDMILGMAQALRLRTVAEGVETEAQRRRLTARGCDILQGYLIGEPITPAEFERIWLASPEGGTEAPAESGHVRSENA